MKCPKCGEQTNHMHSFPYLPDKDAMCNKAEYCIDECWSCRWERKVENPKWEQVKEELLKKYKDGRAKRETV